MRGNSPEFLKVDKTNNPLEGLRNQKLKRLRLLFERNNRVHSEAEALINGPAAVTRETEHYRFKKIAVVMGDSTETGHTVICGLSLVTSLTDIPGNPVKKGDQRVQFHFAVVPNTELPAVIANPHEVNRPDFAHGNPFYAFGALEIQNILTTAAQKPPDVQWWHITRSVKDQVEAIEELHSRVLEAASNVVLNPHLHQPQPQPPDTPYDWEAGGL